VKNYVILTDISDNSIYGIAVKDGENFAAYGAHRRAEEWANWANCQEIKTLEKLLPERIVQSPPSTLHNDSDIFVKSLLDTLIGSTSLVTGKRSYIESHRTNASSATPSARDFHLSAFDIDVRQNAIAYKALAFKSDSTSYSFAALLRNGGAGFNEKTATLNSRFPNLSSSQLQTKIDSFVPRAIQRNVGLNDIAYKSLLKNQDIGRETIEVKKIGTRLGSRLGGGLRAAPKGFVFIDVTGRIDADKDGIVFEGMPLERPIIPRFMVPENLGKKISALLEGSSQDNETLRRAGRLSDANVSNVRGQIQELLGDDSSSLSVVPSGKPTSNVSKPLGTSQARQAIMRVRQGSLTRVGKGGKSRIDTGDSRAVERISWDDDAKELVVTFNGGRTYTYKDVDDKWVRELESNPDFLGRILNDIKKEGYAFERGGEHASANDRSLTKRRDKISMRSRSGGEPLIDLDPLDPEEFTDAQRRQLLNEAADAGLINRNDIDEYIATDSAPENVTDYLEEMGGNFYETEVDDVLAAKIRDLMVARDNKRLDARSRSEGIAEGNADSVIKHWRDSVDDDPERMSAILTEYEGDLVAAMEDHYDDYLNGQLDTFENRRESSTRSRSWQENLPPETFSYGDPENADVPGKKAFRDNSIYVTENADGTFNAYTIENYPGTELGYLRQVGDNNYESLASAKDAASRQKKLSLRESSTRSLSGETTVNIEADRRDAAHDSRLNLMSPNYLDELSRREDVQTRLNVANNDMAYLQTIKDLLKDENLEVRKAADKNIQRRFGAIANQPSSDARKPASRQRRQAARKYLIEHEERMKKAGLRSSSNSDNWNNWVDEMADVPGFTELFNRSYGSPINGKFDNPYKFDPTEPGHYILVGNDIVTPRDLRNMAGLLSTRSASPYSGPVVSGVTLPTWDDLNSMRRIPGPTGLNEGYWFEDDSTKRVFFAKVGRSDGHAQAEVAGAAVYRVAGAGVPHKALITDKDGKTWVVSEKVDNLRGTERPSDIVRAQAKADMGIDMLLQVRDAWSGGSNKLVDSNGVIYTVDTGGAGPYRAQGGSKSPEFSPDAEWSDVATMIYMPGAPIKGQHISNLYGKVSNGDLVKAMRRVEHLNLGEIDREMLDSGVPPEMRKIFNETIEARQKMAKALADKFEEYDPLARVNVAGTDITPGGEKTKSARERVISILPFGKSDGVARQPGKAYFNKISDGPSTRSMTMTPISRNGNTQPKYSDTVRGEVVMRGKHSQGNFDAEIIRLQDGEFAIVARERGDNGKWQLVGYEQSDSTLRGSVDSRLEQSYSTIDEAEEVIRDYVDGPSELDYDAALDYFKELDEINSDYASLNAHTKSNRSASLGEVGGELRLVRPSEGFHYADFERMSDKQLLEEYMTLLTDRWQNISAYTKTNGPGNSVEYQHAIDAIRDRNMFGAIKQIIDKFEPEFQASIRKEIPFKIPGSEFGPDGSYRFDGQRPSLASLRSSRKDFGDEDTEQFTEASMTLAQLGALEKDLALIDDFLSRDLYEYSPDGGGEVDENAEYGLSIARDAVANAIGGVDSFILSDEEYQALRAGIQEITYGRRSRMNSAQKQALDKVQTLLKQIDDNEGNFVTQELAERGHMFDIPMSGTSKYVARFKSIFGRSKKTPYFQKNRDTTSKLSPTLGPDDTPEPAIIQGFKDSDDYDIKFSQWQKLVSRYPDYRKEQGMSGITRPTEQDYEASPRFFDDVRDWDTAQIFSNDSRNIAYSDPNNLSLRSSTKNTAGRQRHRRIRQSIPTEVYDEYLDSDVAKNDYDIFSSRVMRDPEFAKREGLTIARGKKPTIEQYLSSPSYIENVRNFDYQKRNNARRTLELDDVNEIFEEFKKDVESGSAGWNRPNLSTRSAAYRDYESSAAFRDGYNQFSSNIVDPEFRNRQNLSMRDFATEGDYRYSPAFNQDAFLFANGIAPNGGGDKLSTRSGGGTFNGRKPRKAEISTAADLSGANLSGANLSNRNLAYANLQGANLQGANLQVADLTRVDLSGANLEGADLRGTTLQGTNLAGANLAGAKMPSYWKPGDNGTSSDGGTSTRSRGILGPPDSWYEPEDSELEPLEELVGEEWNRGDSDRYYEAARDWTRENVDKYKGMTDDEWDSILDDVNKSDDPITAMHKLFKEYDNSDAFDDDIRSAAESDLDSFYEEYGGRGRRRGSFSTRSRTETRPIGSDLPFDLQTGKPRKRFDETDEEFAKRTRRLEFPILNRASQQGARSSSGIPRSGGLSERKRIASIERGSSLRSASVKGNAFPGYARMDDQDGQLWQSLSPEAQVIAESRALELEESLIKALSGPGEMAIIFDRDGSISGIEMSGKPSRGFVPVGSGANEYVGLWGTDPDFNFWGSTAQKEVKGKNKRQTKKFNALEDYLYVQGELDPSTGKSRLVLSEKGLTRLNVTQAKIRGMLLEERETIEAKPDGSSKTAALKKINKQIKDIDDRISALTVLATARIRAEKTGTNDEGGSRFSLVPEQIPSEMRKELLGKPTLLLGSAGAKNSIFSKWALQQKNQRGTKLRKGTKEYEALKEKYDAGELPQVMLWYNEMASSGQIKKMIDMGLPTPKDLGWKQLPSGGYEPGDIPGDTSLVPDDTNLDFAHSSLLYGFEIPGTTAQKIQTNRKDSFWAKLRLAKVLRPDAEGWKQRHNQRLAKRAAQKKRLKGLLTGQSGFGGERDSVIRTRKELKVLKRLKAERLRLLKNPKRSPDEILALQQSLIDKKTSPFIKSGDGTIVMSPTAIQILSGAVLLKAKKGETTELDKADEKERERLIKKNKSRNLEQNTVMGHLWEESNYDLKPTTVSEEEFVEIANLPGSTVIRRGTGGHTYAEEYLDDPIRYITGQDGEAYGPGEYWSLRKEDGKVQPDGSWRGYVDSDKQTGPNKTRGPGGVMAVLPPSARIVTQKDLEEIKSDISAVTSGIQLAFNDPSMPKEWSNRVGPSNVDALIELVENNLFARVPEDSSRWKTEGGQTVMQLVQALRNANTPEEKKKALSALRYLTEGTNGHLLNLLAPILGYDAIRRGSGVVLVMNRGALVTFNGVGGTGMTDAVENSVNKGIRIPDAMLKRLNNGESVG